MITDATHLEQDSLLCASVVITGTGNDAVTLALTMADAGLSVMLLESGAEKNQYQTPFCARAPGSKLHNQAKPFCFRKLGESSSLQGTCCGPFDSIDFEYRDYVPNSGWPISFNDLKPYYIKANEWLKASDFKYQAKTAFIKEADPATKGCCSSSRYTESQERYFCTTDLYIRHIKRLQHHAKLNLIQDANCIGIELHNNGDSVSHLRIATLNNKRFLVKADHYILATGGIEATRLLLASNNIVSEGIGNRYDNVGRYYMSHIAANIGKLELYCPLKKIDHDHHVSADPNNCHQQISLSEQQQKSLKANNVVLRLHFPSISNAVQKSFNHRPSHVHTILSTPAMIYRFIKKWLFKIILTNFKYLWVLLTKRTHEFSLEVHGEQSPNRDSRITLASEKDALGMPLINIDWRYLPQDIDSVRKTLQELIKALERTGCAILSVDHKAFEEMTLRYRAFEAHPIGTTRMGVDPKTSVVNEHCRIHDIDNLYIAGSSVFPTSSQANPMLTSIALALRLAEHIIEKPVLPSR
jgi:choline dehydrogenase-like flavoprotein